MNFSNKTFLKLFIFIIYLRKHSSIFKSFQTKAFYKSLRISLKFSKADLFTIKTIIFAKLANFLVDWASSSYFNNNLNIFIFVCHALLKNMDVAYMHEKQHLGPQKYKNVQME